MSGGWKLSEETKQKLSEIKKEGYATGKYINHWKGKHFSEEHKRKLSINHANVSGKNHPLYGRRGRASPLYGKHHSEETKQKIKEANSNDRSYRWTGEDVGYTGLHKWIRKNKPKVERCETCNEKKPLEIANISGEYKRDITDFQWLCRKCHQISDGRYEILKNDLKKFGR